jgi:hypothetical protein
MLSAVPVGMEVSWTLVVVDGWTGVTSVVASHGSMQAVSDNPRQRIIVRMNFMMRDSTTQEFAQIALWRLFLIRLVNFVFFSVCSAENQK